MARELAAEADEARAYFAHVEANRARMVYLDMEEEVDIAEREARKAGRFLEESEIYAQLTVADAQVARMKAEVV